MPETRRWLDPLQRAGLPVYAKQFGSVTTPHSTGTVTGTEVGNGYYDFDGLNESLYYTVQVEAVSGTRSASDQILSTLLPNLLEQIAGQTARIGTPNLFINRAILAEAPSRILLGDDYLPENGNAIRVSFPSTFEPASGRLVLWQTDCNGFVQYSYVYIDIPDWTLADGIASSEIAFDKTYLDGTVPGLYHWHVEVTDSSGNVSTPIVSKDQRVKFIEILKVGGR